MILVFLKYVEMYGYVYFFMVVFYDYFIGVFILIFFVGNVWKFSKWIVSVVSVVSKGLLKGKN